jgi:4-amino-4-deoxy-L-arabinose transferase-like glycosyltransferase
MTTEAVTATTVRDRQSDRWMIVGIVGGALVIRVVIVLATRHRYVPTLDAADFSRLAASISHGHGFGSTQIPGLSGATAFRTPAWPALLGAVYWVTGVSASGGRLVIAILSTGLTGLIGAVAWSLVGRRVALVAMAIAAVYPPLLLAGYGLNYEVLMGVAVFGALLCALRWRISPERWWLLAASGLLSGAAILCRENAGFVLVPIIILVWQQLRDKRAALARIGAVVACALIVVTPWTIRNAEQLHTFVPVSDSPGIALAGTYNPTSARYDGEWIPGEVVPAYRHFLTSHPKGENEAQYSAHLQNAAESYAIHHPAYVAEVAFWNTVRFLDLRGPRDSNWLAPLIPWPVKFIELAVLSFYALAIVSIFGLATKRIRGVPWAIWTFPVLWFASIALSTSIMQYRFIVEPFFILLGSLTVVDLLDHSRFRAISTRLGRGPAH